MKILIIVHVEPMFAHLLFDLENLADRIADYADSFDRIINVSCEELLGSNRSYPALQVFEQRDWLWGFDAEYYQEEEPERWQEGINFIPTTGHEYSEILDWMKELPRDAEYILVGGGRDECLQDIYDIWTHLEYKTEINERLTY